MSGKWVHKIPGSSGSSGTLVIDTGALSSLLTRKFGGEVDSLAVSAASVAKAQVPSPGAKKMIGWKSHTKTKTGAPNFQLSSSRLTPLSRQLRVPVALVVNNSRWALEAEVGRAKKQKNGRFKNQRAYRPLRAAAAQMKARPGVRVLIEQDNTISRRSASVRRSHGAQRRS